MSQAPKVKGKTGSRSKETPVSTPQKSGFNPMKLPSSPRCDPRLGVFKLTYRDDDVVNENFKVMIPGNQSKSGKLYQTFFLKSVLMVRLEAFI